MTKSIKGTQTEKNLLTSFAGESQARMRYTYFARLKSLQAILPVLSVILFRICRLQRQANMKNGLWIIRILQMLQNRKVSQ